MDPGTITALATVLSAAAKGAADSFGSASSKKAEYKKAKEMKRKTLAELYNSALDREMNLHKFTSEQGGLNSARRMQALQEAANGFRQSLSG